MSRAKQKTTKLESIAYHEAGHAALAFFHRVPFKYVTIVPNEEEDTLGHVLHRKWPESLRPYSHFVTRFRVYVEKRIMVLLAGPLAETKSTGRRNLIHARSDHRTIANLAGYVCTSDAEAKHFVAWLEERTRQFLETDVVWAGLTGIVKELLAHNVLSSNKARAAYDAGTDAYFASRGIDTHFAEPA